MQITIGGVTEFIYSSSSTDLYIMKLDPFGNVLWVRSFEGNSVDHNNGLEINSLGEIIVVGTFKDTIHFITDTSSHILTSQSAYSDGFIIKLNFGWRLEVG